MGIVHEPVEDAIRQRGIADLLVPARDRQLRDETGVYSPPKECPKSAEVLVH